MFKQSLCLRASGVFLLALILASASFAQSASATLSGTVVDEKGAVVPGATVKITDAARAFERQATTNDNGLFTFVQLQPAAYVVRAERGGFSATETKNVVLNVGDQRSLQIVLRAGEVSATVTVESQSALVNESGSVKTVVDRQFIENQPLNGRSFLPLVELTPGTVLTPTTEGVQGDFSVNGQRPGTNYFTVDGVSANFGVTSNGALQKAGGSYPAYSLQGTTASLASVDAVQEFAIQTSAYAPEFGRQAGAQVSIITRSGTNQLRGGIFNYFRNDALDANDFFANANGLPKPPLRQNDFGFTLGGPVFLPNFGEGGRPFYSGRDRTFFFVSYEGLRLTQPAVSNPQRVPSLAARAMATGLSRDILNAFPLPTGPALASDPLTATFIGSYSNSSSLDATSVRIDHAFNKGLTLFGRFNLAPSEVRARNPNGNNPLNNVSTAKAETMTFTVGTTAILSPNVTNDLRLNYSQAKLRTRWELDNYGGAIVPPDAVIFAPGLATRESAAGGFFIGDIGAYYYPSPNKQRQFNLVNNLSVIRGTHSLKFGFDYRRLTVSNEFPGYQRFYFFDTTADAIAGNTSFTLIGRSDVSPAPLFVNYSAYFQDTWRATKTLTLTYGVRYDVNPPPTFRSGISPYILNGIENPATATLAPPDTPLFETRFGNFAPRVGIAYQLFPDKGTVLRGGFGLFYDLPYSYVGNMLSSDSPPYGGYAFGGGNISDPFFTSFPSPADLIPFRGAMVYAPNFKTPYSLQYNVALEQSIGAHNVFTATYVGSRGRQLERVESRQVPGGIGALPNFTRLDIIRSLASSDYNALQLQYQRRLSNGLQVLASYSLSKSIDDGPATDISLYAPLAPAAVYDPRQDRGPSDFDARHVFSVAVSYQIPSPFKNGIGRAVFGGFALDSIYRARTATPVNVVTGGDPLGFGLEEVYRPDVVPGVPFYLEGNQYPGGRRINPAAFNDPINRQGNLGRNALRGFPVSQLDMSLRRQFNLTERINLQLKIDGFNIFNHPNFANPVSNVYSGFTANLTDPNFGIATQMLGRGFASTNNGVSPLYQIGGPRSLQLSFKLNF